MMSETSAQVFGDPMWLPLSAVAIGLFLIAASWVLKRAVQRMKGKR